MEEMLKKCLEENNIAFDEKKLIDVINISKKYYDDKIMYTGESYIDHSIGVACEIAKLRLDEDAIYAAIMHEILSFPLCDIEQIKALTSDTVVELIKGIDKLNYLGYNDKAKLNENILRKMFMAIAKDIRVVIIKLIDRLYNMRKSEKIADEDLRKIKAKETLEIYAPIAHRLGMSSVKSELEDISFKILYKDEYQSMKKKIDSKKSQREEFINQRIEEIKNRLQKEGVICKIYGRPKHFYSIYKKMKDKSCDIEDIFDLLAIRIIVDSIKDCYTSLGIIHEMYKPMPGRFKDYIAVPKTNNYQSLHTTVFGENSNAFEVQIRTWDMQKHAEYGIAAHFMYKEKTKAKDICQTEQKIMWVRQTLELQKELSKSSENLSMYKLELFGEEVFVFTPKGEIKSLPKGATVIDFAYSIHQNIAEKMIGAKINEKMMPISTILNNTDVVEIITSKNAKGPSLDWLKSVKTASARNKITAYIKKKDSKTNILKGKEYLEKELKKKKIPKDELLKDKVTLKLLDELNCKSMDVLFENIGFGSLSYVKVANKIVEIYNLQNNIKDTYEEKNNQTVKPKSRKIKNDIINVEGIDNCLVKFARCCNPILGDEICGYITYSNGVSIHKSDCPNLKNLDLENRKINVSWVKNIKETMFDTNIKISANYRENLTIEVMKCIQDLKINLKSIKADRGNSQDMSIVITISVEDQDKLNYVIRKIKKIDSVYDARRVR